MKKKKNILILYWFYKTKLYKTSQILSETAKEMTENNLCIKGESWRRNVFWATVDIEVLASSVRPEISEVIPL